MQALQPPPTHTHNTQTQHKTPSIKIQTKILRAGSALNQAEGFCSERLCYSFADQYAVRAALSRNAAFMRRANKPRLLCQPSSLHERNGAARRAKIPQCDRLQKAVSWIILHGATTQIRPLRTPSGLKAPQTENNKNLPQLFPTSFKAIR